MLFVEKDCSQKQILELMELSPSRTVKRITDASTGVQYFWPAELATHRQVADHMGVRYDKKPGEGDILVCD